LIDRSDGTSSQEQVGRDFIDVNPIASAKKVAWLVPDSKMDYSAENNALLIHLFRIHKCEVQFK
jgi:hypothetical protein